MPFGNDHADHVYVSGLGFVSGRDPLHFVERNLHRSASSVGFCLLLLLVLPAVIRWPIEIFSAVNRALISLLFDSGIFASANELFRELRELAVSLFTWLAVLLVMRTVLKPPKMHASTTVGGKRAVLCALLIAVGTGILELCCTSILREFLSWIRLLEMNPGAMMPSRPAAAAVYLVRMLLIPAVFQEALFRGCLLQALRRHGDSFALFFAAFCSGLTHYTLTGNLMGFVSGLVFGYFFLRTGSLKAVIVCHLATLALPMLFTLLNNILPAAVYTIVWPILMISLMVCGLVGFILFCRWNHNAFVLDDSRASSLPFSRKLHICLTSASMFASTLLWLIQIFKNLQVIR
ncbi:MAG: CPBP family intramembrane metalloprotease [Oscillospiraceae bacterium]|nr:CPBP family intramembrane metalloprotease [Oscillospiraceae bacterium]